MDIIQNALEITNFDHIKLAELAGFNEKELIMVKLFWEPAFNKSWIYLSTEIIHDYFGYKKMEYSTRDFHKKMRENYKKDIDYIEVDKDHELIEIYLKNYQDLNLSSKYGGGALKKYYIITGEVLKKMCMRANTVKGNETCDYFIKVEYLCRLMSDYTIEKLKQDSLKLEQEINIAKNKNLNLITKIKVDSMHKPDGYVYLVTCNQYEAENHFRFGKTDDLKSRLENYQIGRTKKDLMKYAFYYKSEKVQLLELFLRHLLKEYRQASDKDIYVLPWYIVSNFMKYVCDTFHNGIIVEKNKLIELNLKFDGISVKLMSLDHHDKTIDYAIAKEIGKVEPIINTICTSINNPIDLSVQSHLKIKESESSDENEDIPVPIKKEKFIIDKRVKKKKSTIKCRTPNAEHQADRDNFDIVNGVKSSICNDCKAQKLNSLKQELLDKFNEIDYDVLNSEDKLKLDTIKAEVNLLQSIDIFKKIRILTTASYKKCVAQFIHATELDSWHLKSNFFIRTENNDRVNDRYSSYCMKCEMAKRK
jgi:phage anti-repressor protein